MGKQSNSRLSSRTRNVVFCGLMVALMVVSAWITIPVGMVPVTLQVYVMIFALLFLTPPQYFISLLVYLLIGAAGLPVFSGMRGGLGVLAGPTGGFLWGFILGALAAFAVMYLLGKWRRGTDVGNAADKASAKKALGKRTLVVDALAASVFLIVMYVCGWAQLMLMMGLDPLAAFLTGVAPFILIDIAKMVVAIITVAAVRKALPNTVQNYS